MHTGLATTWPYDRSKVHMANRYLFNRPEKFHTFSLSIIYITPMGMATRLYGCIVEYATLNEAMLQKVHAHNEQVINDLPGDSWPPISRGMFAINKIEHQLYRANYAYGGRLIHFGGNFKSIEYEWKAWRLKFEDLLTKLLWTGANVHFRTEYAEVQNFEWYINLNKWHIAYDGDPTQPIEPIKHEYWKFDGDLSWDKLSEQ